MAAEDADGEVGDDVFRYTAATVGLLVVAALVLWAMGRTPWGTVSGPGLWTGDIHGELNSQLLADPYVFTHVGHGILFFFLLAWLAGERLTVGARFVAAVGIESVWEIVENTPMVIERFREATMAQGYYGDSILNSMGDIGACMVGFAVAWRLSNRWAAAVFVGLEVVLAFWIRDNLTLNILMLVYPIPGVQEWQAAG